MWEREAEQGQGQGHGVSQRFARGWLWCVHPGGKGAVLVTDLERRWLCRREEPGSLGFSLILILTSSLPF